MADGPTFRDVDTMLAPVTVIRSIKPAMVCKRFTAGPEGIRKTAVASITEGEAETRDVPDAAAMRALLAEVTEAPDLVLCPGVFHGAGRAPFRIVPEAQLAAMLGSKAGEVPGGVHDIGGVRVAARLKRGITAGPWLLLDADNPVGMPAEWRALTIGERLSMLEAVIPGISRCERIELRGSSARVVNGDGRAGIATHAWVRVSNPERIGVLKAFASVATVTAGLAFGSPRYSRLAPGKILGYQQRTVVDLSVWDTGRLVFCARPDVQASGYTVAPAGIEIVNPGGGVLDISGIALPEKAQLADYARRTGHRIEIEPGREAPSIRSYGELTWDTEIVCRGVVRPLREWVATMRGPKKRCEAPFRASTSEAAFIRRRRNGLPVVHDIGCGTTYHFAEDAPPAREREAPDHEGGTDAKATAPPPARERDPFNPKGPLIRVTGGNLHIEASAGEAALVAAGRPIYQRGNNLVRPAMQVVTAARGRSTLAASLVEIGAAGLTDALCQAANWERFDKRSQEWARINPPAAVAATILSRAGEWSFPRIAGVITTPTLRPDGSLLSEPGYDATTRLYHMADPDLVLRPSVHAPTRKNAEAALRLLNDLLAEFPFVDAASRSVALSGIITPVVRGCMPVAPLHAFRAFTAGTGKSYLADVASAVSTGRPCPVSSAGRDEAETEKRLAALLLAGFPIVCLDNVNGELGGDLLCQAVERPLIRLRPLGASQTVEIESRATFFATGNALRVCGDMVRRTVVCGLDAQMERPELREFKADPLARILDNRGLYVSACLVIVRAFATLAGADRLKPIASYAEWSDLVRSALVWLGCEDPAASMLTARDDDPELSELREMLTLWSQALGAAPMTAKELADAVNRREETKYGEPTDYRFPDLRDAILRIAGERGEINTKRLGRWLMSREGRIVDGRRFTRATTQGHGGVVKWQVVSEGRT